MGFYGGNIFKSTLRKIKKRKALQFLAFLSSLYAFYYILAIKKESNDFKEERSQIFFYSQLNQYFAIANHEWRVKLKPSELYMKEHLHNHYINCSSTKLINLDQIIATGWSKALYKATYNNQSVAVKTVNFYGHAMSECLQYKLLDWHACYQLASIKILREIMFLQSISHENVIQMIGYCIPEAEETRSLIVVELGTPLDLIKLLQLSWTRRVEIILGVAKLIYHLSTSSLGPLLMNDFRRQQFVSVNGQVKLSDMDDISIGDPVCSGDPCVLRKANQTVVIPCQSGVCKGFNDRTNILLAGKHFVNFLLPYETPIQVESLTQEIMSGFKQANVSSQILYEKTANLMQIVQRRLSKPNKRKSLIQ